jgi:DNA-binding NarL/FixJ family response regulator
MNCGIDLIGVSISDGIPGFTIFLKKYDGSFGRIISKTEWQTRFSFNFYNFNYEGTYNRGAKRLSIRVGALTQYSDTSKAYRRWVLLQHLCSYYTSSLNINELHLAVDIPYRYADINISPASSVYQPRFLSSKYFDSKRSSRASLGRDDDFVIYDKCRKCRIGIPLTRIELRLKTLASDDIIYDADTQKKIATKIKKKFKDIKVKKSRSIVKLSSCEWEQVISDAIRFITIDSSMYKSTLKHRDEEIAKTGLVFKSYMKFCKDNHIYSAKPQNVAKSQSFLTNLSPQERHMLNTTIASYNAYDKKWYKDSRFMMKVEHTRKRLTIELKEEILFMLELGQTQASIAEELNVSESTISRWLDGYVKLRDSKFLKLIDLSI